MSSPRRRTTPILLQSTTYGEGMCKYAIEGKCIGQNAAKQSLQVLDTMEITDEMTLRGREITRDVATNGPSGRGKKNECAEPSRCNYFTRR